MSTGLTLLLRAIYFSLVLSLCSCTFSVYTYKGKSYYSEADRAEALQAGGELEKAIEAYEAHIKNRISSKKRFSNENPYFYKLMIGDLHLKLDQIDEAEKSYLSACNHKVSPPLCADRLRKMGRYFEEKKEYDKAFEILRKHRELDILLFDLEIDRLHKSIVNSTKNQSETTDN